MNSNVSLSNKKGVLKQLGDILKLYSDSSFSELYDDLVAIGTVPVPDFPKPSFVVKSKGSVKIDTVPLPEKQRKLKGLVKDLLTDSDEIPIKKLFNL